MGSLVKTYMLVQDVQPAKLLHSLLSHLLGSLQSTQDRKRFAIFVDCRLPMRWLNEVHINRFV
jgi:hypothetical protein